MPGKKDSTRNLFEVRTGQASTRLSREEFEARYRAQFFDPAFEAVRGEVDRITRSHGRAYGKRAAKVRYAESGPGVCRSDAEFIRGMAGDEARDRGGGTEQKRTGGPSRVLVICASPRTDETCPSEMSKRTGLRRRHGGDGRNGGMQRGFAGISAR